MNYKKTNSLGKCTDSFRTDQQPTNGKSKIMRWFPKKIFVQQPSST